MLLHVLLSLVEAGEVCVEISSLRSSSCPAMGCSFHLTLWTSWCSLESVLCCQRLYSLSKLAERPMKLHIGQASLPSTTKTAIAIGWSSGGHLASLYAVLLERFGSATKIVIFAFDSRMAGPSSIFSGPELVPFCRLSLGTMNEITCTLFPVSIINRDSSWCWPDDCHVASRRCLGCVAGSSVRLPDSNHFEISDEFALDLATRLGTCFSPPQSSKSTMSDEASMVSCCKRGNPKKGNRLIEYLYGFADMCAHP